MAALISRSYQIIVQAHLDPGWAVWFEGMTMTEGPGGTTVLTGTVVDQAALHGLLARIRDLGLPLVALQPITPPQRQDKHRDD